MKMVNTKYNVATKASRKAIYDLNNAKHHRVNIELIGVKVDTDNCQVDRYAILYTYERCIYMLQIYFRVTFLFHLGYNICKIICHMILLCCQQSIVSKG